MTKRIALICMILGLALTMAGCQGLLEKDSLPEPEPESMEELWLYAIMNSRDQLESAIELEVNMVLFMQGYAIETKATGSMIEDMGEEYYYYSEINAEVSCKELDMSQKTHTVRAYIDGKAYELLEQEDTVCKLYGEMSAQEHLAYRELIQGNDDKEHKDFDLWDCTTKEFAKNEDGTWTMSYAGYTKRAMDRITREFDTSLDVFGAEILDMELDVHLDAEYGITSIEIRFVFKQNESQEVKPCIEIKVSPAEKNEVNHPAKMPDADTYIKVDDLAMVIKLERMIEDRCNAEQGSIRYEQTDKVIFAGQEQSYSELTNIEYGVRDGKYYYNVWYETDGNRVEMSYSNGICTIVENGERYTSEESEQEAKDWINSWINDPGFDYNSNNVIGLEQIGEDEWKITQRVVSEEYFALQMETLGAKYKSTTQTLYVKVKDGVLVSMTNSIVTRGTLKVGNTDYELQYASQSTTNFS